jgi:hypothetical protein
MHDKLTRQDIDLMEKELVTDQIVLTVSYDAANLADPERAKRYTGPVTKSYYGKPVPKHAHGSRNLPRQTALARELVEAALSIYEGIFTPTADGEWIGPRFVGVWGIPKKKKLRTITAAEQKRLSEYAERLYTEICK